jgi:hypothetical protein
MADLLHYGLLWLIPILLVLNIAGIAIIQSEDRYWLPVIILWIALLGTLVVNHALNVTSYEDKASSLTRPSEKPVDTAFVLSELDQERKTNKEGNLLLFRLLGAQTLFGFLFLALGYQRTIRPFYKKAMVNFFLLLVGYVLIEVVRLVI